MIGNIALDVFIGLVFVFLLYSLLATIVQEIIASFLNLRAVVLVKAIRIMLNDRKPLNIKSKYFLGQLCERFLFTAQMQWHHISCRLPDFSLAKAFYKHPSIKYLSPNSLRSKPSYIEPQNFSATMIQMLRGKDYDGSVPQMLAIYNTLFPMKTAAQPGTHLAEVEVGQTDPVLAVIQPETLDRMRQLYIDAQRDINCLCSVARKLVQPDNGPRNRLVQTTNPQNPFFHRAHHCYLGQCRHYKNLPHTIQRQNSERPDGAACSGGTTEICRSGRSYPRQPANKQRCCRFRQFGNDRC